MSASIVQAKLDERRIAVVHDAEHMDSSRFARRRIVLELAAAGGFLLWQVIILFRFWNIATWEDLVDSIRDQDARQYQLTGIAIFLVAGMPYVITNTSVMLKIWLSNPRFVGILMFCICAVALSPLSVQPLQSAGYGVLMLATLVCLSSLWIMEPSRRTRLFQLTSCAIVVFLLLLVLRHGYQGRLIGWIKPNDIGGLGFAAAWLGFAAGGILGYVGLVAGAVFGLLVNARGFSLCIAAMFIIVVFSRSGVVARILITLSILTAIGVFIAIDRLSGAGTDPLESFLQMNDVDRGVGSGMTGRTDLWNKGISLSFDNYLIGYGFKTRGGTDAFISANHQEAIFNAHSGYINLLLDTGIVGWILLIFVMVAALFHAYQLRYAERSIPEYPALRQNLNSDVIGAGMLVYTVIFMLEPTYINFGNNYVAIFLTFLVFFPHDEDALID